MTVIGSLCYFGLELQNRFISLLMLLMRVYCAHWYEDGKKQLNLCSELVYV